MVALESAERAVRTLREHPLLFAAAGVFAVLKLPVEVTRPLRVTYDVYAVLALVTFPFTPVLLAGLYGLADRSLDGEAGSFWEAVGDGYGSLVLANLLYALVQHVLMLVFAVVAAVTFFVLVGGAGIALRSEGSRAVAREAVQAAGLLGVGGVVLVSFVYLLVRFTVAFFCQLYKPAAAVGGNDPLAAFAESVSLVRANPERTLGFVLVRLLAMVVLLLPGVLAAVAVVYVESSLLGGLTRATAGVVISAVVVVAFAVGVVELAFLSTYRVAFYRSLVDDGA